MRAAEFFAVEVYDDHALGLHHSFADAGGRDQDALLVQPHGEVAVSRGHQALGMQHLAEAYQVLAQGAFAAPFAA